MYKEFCYYFYYYSYSLLNAIENFSYWPYVIGALAVIMIGLAARE